MPTSFTDLDGFRAAVAISPAPHGAVILEARLRNKELTKPFGALGRLEELAIWYAGWRGEVRPEVRAPQVIVFAGNHGIAARGVSAFPPEVTQQMVANFKAGGAAINQLSNLFGAEMSVHALDLDQPTVDFTKGPAMSEAELVAALQTGWNAVNPQADLLVAGEMGIGNTTSAAAIACALWGGEPEDWAGRGTGVDEAGVAYKAAVVGEGLALHQSRDPLDVLRCFGGRELAAIVGAIARAGAERIPVILDGFICCAAASVLDRMQPGALDHCVAGHASAEAAHPVLLRHLNKEPLLGLNLRLGEGSGAALAIGVLKGAVACHSGMASFAEAGVSEG